MFIHQNSIEYKYLHGENDVSEVLLLKTLTKKVLSYWYAFNINIVIEVFVIY